VIKRLRAFFARKKLNASQRARIRTIEKLAGITVYRTELYLKALRHRSKVAEDNMSPSESYERLEFIGDAVLDLIASEIIFQKYPDANEGFMTQLRSKLVKGQMLAEMARNISLMHLVELGERVRNQGVEDTDSVLADVFEALIGALFMDQGYQRARKFVMKLYEQYISLDNLVSLQDNFKSALLELAQHRKLPAPLYQTIRETGPGHNKLFDVQVTVNNTVIGLGSGPNKKKAEQEAARQAIEALQKS
jgi:ribonuclease-3